MCLSFFYSPFAFCLFSLDCRRPTKTKSNSTQTPNSSSTALKSHNSDDVVGNSKLSVNAAEFFPSTSTYTYEVIHVNSEMLFDETYYLFKMFRWRIVKSVFIHFPCAAKSIFKKICIVFIFHVGELSPHNFT